ncbi:MAG: ABC transporter ATP-binding protein [Burkholderiales bacterium]
MAEVLLSLVNVEKHFGGVSATDRTSLDVRLGEIHALIGPNGAGKTTLVHQISGLLRPDAGSIHFDSIDVTHWPMYRRVRKGLVRSFQVTSIFSQLTAIENALLAVQAGAGSSLRFWHPVRTEKALHELASEVLARVGLAERGSSMAGSLAHGEQRRLEVGLALAARPKLLLLDEPLAGMSPDESQQMVNLIWQLKSETTLLLIEHDMAAVFRLADRVSVMVSGRIIATGAPSDIRANEAVRKAYLGDEVSA